MNQTRRFRLGFTLIELLIVVAIIAILAAIAVPNFLEAQARSKVSRTKADMRSNATALEAYFVDNNAYPPDFSAVSRGAGHPQYNMLIARLAHLTSPVAYITSVIPAPLNEIVAKNGSVTPAGAATSSAPFRVGGVASGAIINPVCYDYAAFDRKEPPFDNPVIWAEITASPESVQWALNSAGPNGKIFQYLGFNNLTIYDPTNGTVSYGQIIRTNVSAEDKPKNL